VGVCWGGGLGIIIVVGEDCYFDIWDGGELEIGKDIRDCYSNIIVG
jgi:hypothetical protein